MKTRNIQAPALATALSIGTFALMVPTAACATKLATHASSGMSISLHYENSARKVEQSGSAQISVNEDEWFGTTFLSARDTKAKERQQQLYVRMSLPASPRVEVHGRLGASKTHVRNARTTFVLTNFDDDGLYGSDSGSEAIGTASRGEWGLMAGIGAKIRMHQWQESDIGLSLNVDYEYHKASGKSGHVLGNRQSHELMGALVLAKLTGPFRPYGGFSYSAFKSKYKVDLEVGNMQKIPDRMTFKNRSPLGALAGFEYSVTPNMSLSAEARTGTTKAINIGFNYLF